MEKEQKEFLDTIQAKVAEQIESAKKEMGKPLTTEEVKSIVSEALKGIPTGVSEKEVAELKEVLLNQGKAINELKANGTESKEMNVAEAIVFAFKEAKINSVADIRANKELLNQGIEIKANITTSSQTGTIGRTQEVSPVRFANLRPLAFIPNVKTGSISNGKSVLLWTPGTYTSNAGYAGEGANTVTENSGTAQEKTRATAKISAKQYITAETFEDLPQFAQRLQDQLTGNAYLFLDNEILNGDGNDSTAPTHIYGIIGQGSTDFDAASAAKISKPNVGDLVDACATQAEIALHQVNTVWMHPKTANKLRRTKDDDGQYIVNQILGGGEVLGAYKVVRTSGIGEGKLLVANDMAIQLWIKRNLTMRIGQFSSTDVENDRFTSILFTRAQVLVEDEDKKAVIYVEDIDAALALMAY